MTNALDMMIDEPREASFLGLTNRVLAAREHTDGSVTVVEITVPAGGGVPLHVNTREALTWYVIEGTLTFVREQGASEVKAGRAIFLPKGPPQHTFLNQTDQPVKALLICTPGGFEGFLTEMAANFPAEAPQGPPPTEALEGMRAIGARYGLEFSDG
jgi:quercetin dioxygenase-like cupin family protein